MLSSLAPIASCNAADRTQVVLRATSVCLEAPSVATSPAQRRRSGTPAVAAAQPDIRHQQAWACQQQLIGSMKRLELDQDAAAHHGSNREWQPCNQQHPSSSSSSSSDRRRSRTGSSHARSYQHHHAVGSSRCDGTGTSTDSSRVGSSTSTSPTNSSSGRRAARLQWTQSHSKLLQVLRQQQLLPEGSRVLVGVSGGQDSLALLRLLHDLNQQQHWRLQLVVGHCDHRVRPDSAAAAAHVQRYSQQLGLQYMQAVADREQGHWPEKPAREWRLSQLACMAQEACCSHVALGHTATERAETVLFNMIRGAGPRGLAAMGWSRQLAPGLQLVRPLLCLTRAETQEACELTGTQVYPDSTNTDQHYARNRLRLSVFPLLLGINSSAVEHICNLADIAESEGDLLLAATKKQLAAAVVPCQLVQAAWLQQQQQQQQQQEQEQEQEQGVLLQQQQQQQSPVPAQEPADDSSLCCDALSLKDLAEMHPAMQRRVVLLWLTQHRGRSVGFAYVSQVLRLLCSGQSTGARSSTLWGSSCVLRFKELLLLLDADHVQQVLSGGLRVLRVSVQKVSLRQPVPTAWHVHYFHLPEVGGVAESSAATVGLAGRGAGAAAAPGSGAGGDGHMAGAATFRGRGRRRRRAASVGVGV